MAACNISALCSTSTLLLRIDGQFRRSQLRVFGKATRTSTSHKASPTFTERLAPATQQTTIPRRQPRRSAGLICRAADSSTELVEDNTFRIEKISFGSILTPVGIFLLVYGFGAFFQLLPGSDIAAVMLVYGFPISILGFALSYAQLEPVPCKTTRAAAELRESQATAIQKQLRDDVTRFRYGDEQHLDESLTRIFMFNRPQGIPRRFTPKLMGIREEVVEGQYTLVLEFETREDMAFEMWTERQGKFQSFFGPGITASFTKTDQGVDVVLQCDGSGAGRDGGEQKDVLPPLMPGLPARRQ